MSEVFGTRGVNATGICRLLHTNRTKSGAICPALRASNTVRRELSRRV
jgi:hypothetical protein